MPNHISVASVVEKNRLGSSVPYLVCLDVDIPDPVTGAVLETMHLVNNTEDIVLQGVTYLKMPFSIELKQESGAMPQITLTVTDYSRALLEKLNNNGGGVGFNVKVSVFNSDTLDRPPEVTEFFEVLNADASNYVVSFTLGAENALARQFPRRTQRRDFCQWVYKDLDTCRYTGQLTACDRSLNGAMGCSKHNNVVNFGGFPSLTSANSVYR
jgi:hypothetical protein